MRDKVMDRYWLEFLESYNFTRSYTSTTYTDRLETVFWRWFYEEKLLEEKKAKTTLEDYL